MTKDPSTTKQTWDETSKEGKLLAKLHVQLKCANEDTARWAALFTANPDRALDNSDRVFMANSQRKIASLVIDALTQPASNACFESIREYVVDKLITDGRRIERSTSFCDNLSHRSDLAAWADLLGVMKWI